MNAAQQVELARLLQANDLTELRAGVGRLAAIKLPDDEKITERRFPQLLDALPRIAPKLLAAGKREHMVLTGLLLLCLSAPARVSRSLSEQQCSALMAAAAAHCATLRGAGDTAFCILASTALGRVLHAAGTKRFNAMDAYITQVRPRAAACCTCSTAVHAMPCPQQQHAVEKASPARFVSCVSKILRMQMRAAFPHKYVSRMMRLG